VLNPVKAKAVEKVEQWTWSSYRETTSLATCSPWLAGDWVLGQVGTNRPQAIRFYRRCVKEGIARPSIWDVRKTSALLMRDAHRISTG
jgi:putative transposase